MTRLLALCLVSSALYAGEPVTSWVRLDYKERQNFEAMGFVATELAQRVNTLRISHEIRIGAGDQSVSASTHVVYDHDGDKLIPSEVGLTTDVKGNAKIESIVEFIPDGFSESFTMMRDLSGEEIANPVPWVSDRQLKYKQFVHLWSLPHLAPMLLPKAGELTIAFPKFPDRTPISKRTSITSNKDLYYVLRRESIPDSSDARFTATPFGAERPQWIMLLTGDGKLRSLEMPGKMRITPSTEAEFTKWAESQ